MKICLWTQSLDAKSFPAFLVTGLGHLESKRLMDISEGPEDEDFRECFNKASEISNSIKSAKHSMLVCKSENFRMAIRPKKIIQNSGIEGWFDLLKLEHDSIGREAGITGYFELGSDDLDKNWSNQINLIIVNFLEILKWDINEEIIQALTQTMSEIPHEEIKNIFSLQIKKAKTKLKILIVDCPKRMFSTAKKKLYSKGDEK